MACKYMIFIPVFLAILIHRIIFSLQFKSIVACNYLSYLDFTNGWLSLMQIFKIKKHAAKNQ